MQKLILFLVSCFLFTSCAIQPRAKIIVEQYRDSTDFILPGVKADIHNRVLDDHESVTLTFTTSIDYTGDTSIFLTITSISHEPYKIKPDSSLTMWFGDYWKNFYCVHTDDSAYIHEIINNNEIVFFNVAGAAPGGCYRPSDKTRIYYRTSAIYEIDRNFIDNLFKERYCEFTVLLNGSLIDGSLDLDFNREFDQYYERFYY